MASPSRSNARSNRVWKKLGEWYGSRFGDVYGPEPPDDWRACVDEASNDEVVAVLALIRQRHVTFPPTLPEFQALFREARNARGGNTEPAMHDRLADFAVRRRTLTFSQMRNWTFLYREQDGAQVTTALVIPADRDRPGYRIAVDDMLAEETEVGREKIVSREKSRGARP
jgi:hypothetical protein